MTIRKVEIERLSVISSKPFEEVLTTLEAAIGHPDMVEFMKAMHASSTFAEFESVVHKQLGTTGLMMFMKFDQGVVLRKETGLNTPSALCDWQSAHHERNDEACSRRWRLCSGHDSSG